MRRQILSTICFLSLLLWSADASAQISWSLDLSGASGQTTIGEWGIGNSSGSQSRAPRWPRRGRYPSRDNCWTWYLPPVIVPWTNVGYTFTLPYDVAPPAVAQPATNSAVPAPADPDPAGPRASSPQQKAKAGRYLSYGDAQFAKQNYAGAIGRYRTAARTAPDLAEGSLRQGFAYVALGQHESAGDAFRRALGVQPNWQGTAFRLATLYDGAQAAKTQHLENLAKGVENNPFDTNLLFVLGVALFFDGQFDRAELCFGRAEQLGGNADGLLDYFLPPGAGPDPTAAPSGNVKF